MMGYVIGQDGLRYWAGWVMCYWEGALVVKIDVSIGHDFLSVSKVGLDGDLLLLESQKVLDFLVVAEDGIVSGVVAVLDEFGGVVDEQDGVAQHQQSGRTVPDYHPVVFLEDVVAEVYHIV